MDIRGIAHGHCSIGRGVARVGDPWSALLLRDASRGMSRFEQFRVSLNIAPNILTSRLRALTEAGLLKRRRYLEHPPRYEYVLTDAGRDFVPVLHAIGHWAERHYDLGGDSGALP